MAGDVTVAVALVTTDGVVLASDSMGADRSVATVLPKIRICPGLPLAWAFAGSAYLGQAVRRDVDQLAESQGGDWASLRKFDVLDALAALVRAAVADATAGLADDASDDSRAAEFMFAGTAADGPYVIVVHADMSALLEEDQRLVAIGGTRHFAAAARQCLAHYLEQTPDARHALPLAWRVVDAVCRVSSFGVAAPVQMAVVDVDGARMLTEADVSSVEEQVQAWLSAEAVTLRRPGSAAAPAEVPRLERTADERAG